MAVILKPTTDLVATAWIKGVTGVDESAVGAKVPRDETSWRETGFIKVISGIGGGRQIHIPQMEPVVRVEGIATNGTSKKPPWAKANNLLELLYAGTFENDGIRTVTLPGDYPSVRVIGVYFLSEPQRITTDEGSWARYFADMQFHWVESA